MPLSITYTCNWCNKTHKMLEVKTPPEWIDHPVHDPETGGVMDAFFCKEECKSLHVAHEPGAQDAARIQYVQKFYSFLNEKKAEEAAKPEIEAAP